MKELININTPNKDILTSFIYAWSRQKEMSILEQRIVLRILEFASNRLKGIKIKDNMRKLDLGLLNVTISMPATDVLFNSKMKHKDIEKALYDLRGRTFEFYDNKRYTVCGIINNATYVFRSGIITVEVDNKMWQVLTDFSIGFRRFELNKALALPTSYSLQFYMVLSGQDRPVRISVADLKSWLGIAPDKYKKDGKDRIDHLEERILKPVKKILDDNCPYSFNYTKIREKPSNSKSTVIGFEFAPFYQAKKRDSQLEHIVNTAKTPTSYLDPQAVAYMRQRMDIPLQSLMPHKELIETASKTLPDFIGTLAHIQGHRRKKNGEYMGVGWVIQAIKGEVEKQLEIERAAAGDGKAKENPGMSVGETSLERDKNPETNGDAATGMSAEEARRKMDAIRKGLAEHFATKNRR